MFKQLETWAKGVLLTRRINAALKHRWLVEPTPMPVHAVHAGITPRKITFVVGSIRKGYGGHTSILRLGTALSILGYDVNYYLTGGMTGALAAAMVNEQDFQGTLTDSFPADTCYGVATGHKTAYELLHFNCPKKLYFVQDYEPLFTAGSLDSLAAAKTYEFGFMILTLGNWLSRHISKIHGVPCHPLPFPVQGQTLPLEAARTRIAVYCQPEKPRRCFELAMASASAIYNVIRERRLPYTLDLFGSPLLRSARYPFTANAHGVLEHEKMLSLLRESKVGISFSATNMALLPFEMLMAGCLPIELRSENVLLEAENNNPPIMALADFNPKSVQEQFLWVLSHPAEASAMVERGREFLKSRTWQSVGEHFVKAMLQP